jgi:hypothetical protein
VEAAVRIFFSGIGNGNIDRSDRLPPGTRYRLASCHGSYIRAAHGIAQDLVDWGGDFELMLDSGAFTAWSKGHEVTLDHLIPVYADMLAKFEKHATAVWLINLDKIPGSRGRTATVEEMEEAIEISDQNFNALVKEFGPRVLPVFHQNETTERLHQVASMADFVCISPRNDVAEKYRVSWSQEVHALIPGKRTHGLAATGKTMMTTVPWWSVDSATWVFVAGNGGIFFDHSMKVLAMSSKSPSLKDMDEHYQTLSPMRKAHVDTVIASRGFTPEQLAEDHSLRMLWNRIIMMEVYQNIGGVKVPDPLSLFDL